MDYNNEVNLRRNSGERNENNMTNEQRNNYNSNSNIFTFIRFVIISGGLFIICLNTIYGFALPHGNVDCFLDHSFEYTSGINKYLTDNVTARHLLIAFSSLCLDFIMLYMGFYWALYSKSWRMLATLLCFYAFRGIIQGLFEMRYPPGYLWEYPDFPSITISYLKTSDFFFSGHVGLPIIVGLECYRLDKKYMFIFCLFTCLTECFTMIVTRGHYSIDIVTGIIVAHYTFILVDQNIHILDNSFIGMNKDIRNNENVNNDKPEFVPVTIKNYNEV